MGQCLSTTDGENIKKNKNKNSFDPDRSSSDSSEDFESIAETSENSGNKDSRDKKNIGINHLDDT